MRDGYARSREEGVTQARSSDLVEVILTPTIEQYGEMGLDLEQARKALGLPKSASKTKVIHAALRCVAGSK
jgi:hypothetical protein